MKNNLPPLDQELLNIIFDSVYIGYKQTSGERIHALVDTLYAMLQFNFFFRPDDTGRLFDLFDVQFNFVPNTEDTKTWLALILAVQEIYGLTDSKLVEVMRQVVLKEKLTDFDSGDQFADGEDGWEGFVPPLIIVMRDNTAPQSEKSE